MTLEGTNTYLYGADPCVVIDPGDDDPAHLGAIRVAAAARGGIGLVLLTHSHRDHSEGAEELEAEVVLPGHGEEHLGLRVLATPGHAADHVSFLTAEGVCFAGDLVLGLGSTIVPPGGGALAAYMDSLALLQQQALDLIAPGHGPWITDPQAKLAEYVEHRSFRERRLLVALEAGERSRAALLQRVWDDVPVELLPMAAMAMEAHLEKLSEEDRLPEGLTE
jgi:glyoxylase-like metal-dependent hydrolase (beta-lactamase superfamily II)